MQRQQQYQQMKSRVPDDTLSNHNHKQSRKSGLKNFSYMTSTTTTQPKLASPHAVQNSSHGLLAHLYGSSQQPLKCKFCNKSFEKFSTLRKHELLHKMNNFQMTPDIDMMQAAKNENEKALSLSSSSSHGKLPFPSTAAATTATLSTAAAASALTLTPSLLSNLNKLANLKSTDCSDGKKPAILININTNDSATPKVETAKKSQEMPLNSNSGLMISSVTSLDKNYFDAMEKQRNAAANATVFIQNGKKAVSLAELQCPICKKIVSQPFSLKVHLRTHTLEK